MYPYLDSLTGSATKKCTIQKWISFLTLIYLIIGMQGLSVVYLMCHTIDINWNVGIIKHKTVNPCQIKKLDVPNMLKNQFLMTVNLNFVSIKNSRNNQLRKIWYSILYAIKTVWCDIWMRIILPYLHRLIFFWLQERKHCCEDKR